jgi:hypothetical protein
MNNKANKIRGQTNNIVASTVCTVGYSSIPHAIAHRSPGYGCKSSGWETVTEPRMTEPRKTEPRKTERRKTEPRKTEPRKTEPRKTEHRKGPNIERPNLEWDQTSKD